MSYHNNIQSVYRQFIVYVILAKDFQICDHQMRSNSLEQSFVQSKSYIVFFERMYEGK